MGRRAEGGAHAAHANDGRPEEGEVQCEGAHVRLRGSALRLVLWIAGHQTRINDLAPESGQLWLTWKGSAIDGDIRTRL